MNLKEMLVKDGRKYNTADKLMKYCSKELKITVDKFKKTQDLKRLKKNMRRMVDLIIERTGISKDKVIDYFSFEYLDFCEYKMTIMLDTKRIVKIPEFCDWGEMGILLTYEDGVEVLKEKQKNTITILKLKELFGGKITVE